MRQVFYQGVVRGLVPKDESKGYKLVQRRLVKLRECGDVPYGWITDNVRIVRGHNRYGGPDDYGTRVASPSLQGYKEDPSTGITEGFKVVRSRSIGRYYLKLPAEELTASNIVALYLIAFATGSLVRYHPGYWMSVICRGRGGLVAPILPAAVSVVEEQFPA